MAEFLQDVKSLADELALIDHPIPQDDLTLYILDGLGEDYTGIVGSIRTRETPFCFEELKDILVAQEGFISRLTSAAPLSFTTANYHYKQPGANHPPSQGRGNGPPRSNWNSNRSNQNWNNNRSSSSGGRGRGYNRVVCQLCDKPGHPANKC
ncbi:uncharacterized protein LOC119995291 [Tripterygium wilfordii]|uniref:uncharacterized protein LOC119995291 n=1 Tax=Tripterygium wilfordii TaxID=458696 RepID=UPI0018F81A60|nr:uncharacterized protein LOC119995291 [Tripterygium wilfordii]